MQMVFFSLDALAAAVIFLPIFWWLNRRRFHNFKKTVWYFIMAVYFSGVYAAVGLPDIRYIRLDFNINLIPFAYMFSAYRSSLLNVLLFVPLGFFLTMLWEKFGKLGWTVLFGFCTSLCIELLQLFTFRATDVNDLITNTFGTMAGWCVGRLLLRLFPGQTPEKDTENAFLVCGVSFFVMFFLQPFLADLVFPFL